jgi:hypothetical protein
MEIFLQVIVLYGITLLVSMGVAVIIWGMAKLIDFLPDSASKSK